MKATLDRSPIPNVMSTPKTQTVIDRYQSLIAHHSPMTLAPFQWRSQTACQSGIQNWWSHFKQASRSNTRVWILPVNDRWQSTGVYHQFKQQLNRWPSCSCWQLPPLQLKPQSSSSCIRLGSSDQVRFQSGCIRVALNGLGDPDNGRWESIVS